MWKLLATTVVIVTGAMYFGWVPAKAATTCTTDASGNTVCDPTAFHVTDSLGSGTSPVLLNEATTFNVDDINNGDTIDTPLKVFLAVPKGESAPTITSYSFDNGTPVTTGLGLTVLGTWVPGNGNGNDLDFFDGNTGSNASINKTNVDAAENAIGIAGTPSFTVYEIDIPQGFNAQGQFETVNGSFPLGTIVAPYSEDVVVGNNGKTTTTFYDTSWTNAGFVNTQAVIPTPEPSTIALLGLGLLGTLAVARRTNSR